MNPLNRSVRRCAGIALALLAAPAFAAPASPAGRWKTIDDQTHEVRSIVEITEANGALEGRVLKVLKSETGPNPVCKLCQDERKDQPIEGMTILRGVKADGDAWSGGEILDPKNGKTYKVTLKLVDGGSKLDVHGYIGVSLFGRSQEWVRDDAP